jgi:hypothetical protein
MGGGNAQKTAMSREKHRLKAESTKKVDPAEAKAARDLRSGVGQAERMAAAAAKRAEVAKKREEKGK